MSLARVRKSKAPVEAIKPRVPGSKYWVSRATKSYIFMAYFYGKQDFKATIIIPLMWEYLWTGMAPESKYMQKLQYQMTLATKQEFFFTK